MCTLYPTCSTVLLIGGSYSGKMKEFRQANFIQTSLVIVPTRRQRISHKMSTKSRFLGPQNQSLGISGSREFEPSRNIEFACKVASLFGRLILIFSQSWTSRVLVSGCYKLQILQDLKVSELNFDHRKASDVSRNGLLLCFQFAFTTLNNSLLFLVALRELSRELWVINYNFGELSA